MDEPGHHHEHGPGCDHDHDHEHEHMVTFENEDGTTSEYPVVDEFEFDGELYVLVLNSDETVTPLKSMGEDGERCALHPRHHRRLQAPVRSAPGTNKLSSR
jgi:uncharacterized protein YrzB (UPF0473 family)